MSANTLLAVKDHGDAELLELKGQREEKLRDVARINGQIALIESMRLLQTLTEEGNLPQVNVAMIGGVSGEASLRESRGSKGS